MGKQRLLLLCQMDKRARRIKVQLKVHQRYQRHRWQICHRYQQHRRQILPPIQLVLLIPVAKLPQVSTTPDTATTQIMRTLSGCRHLKVNLKAKIYIYVNSATQRCQKKKIMFEDFSIYQNETSSAP
jgi:hypothetical protein